MILKEGIYTTELYIIHKLYQTVQKMFKKQFPGKDVPDKSSIIGIIQELRMRGIVCNLLYECEKTALTSQVLVTMSLARTQRGVKFLHKVLNEIN